MRRIQTRCLRLSRYISTQAQLEELANELRDSKILAIDTEFMREKHYYAKLCLLQLNNGSTSAIVDPLSVSDLSPLVSILVDETCVKIFHAGTQDIDILYHETGVTPFPVFDTQVAASLLGYPLQVGYGPLVRSVCDVHLAKADSYTDWSKRPLTDSQIEYALDDVVYLPRIYETLHGKLIEKNRLSWCEQEFVDLSNPKNYDVDLREIWRKVKRVSSLSGAQLAIARELAEWREKEAMHRNIPRKWILADEALVETARKAPRSKEALFEIRGLASKLNGRDVNQILEAIRKGKNTPQDQWPRLEKFPKGDAEAEGAVELLSALLEMRAKQHDVAASLLATHSDLSKLVRGHHSGLALLEGWRYDIAGKELLDLLAGKLALFLDDGKISVIAR